jgi:amino acid adenylation domain-containing protein
MNIETLIKILADHNISIWYEQDRLLVSSPKGGLTDSLRASLREHKDELLKRLRSGHLLACNYDKNSHINVPPNAISLASTHITPDMLPLIALTQADINRIIDQVPGGIANIQDIYALSPLQEGLLFHHLLANDSDPYLVVSQIVFADRDLLNRFLDATQQVVDRHDILRTALVWQGLSEPAQVVWRKAPLSITEVSLDATSGPASEQLARRFDPRHTRIDLTQAPLLRFFIAQEPGSSRWVMVYLQHHMVGDNVTTQLLQNEVTTILTSQGHTLPPSRPFRNMVAQVRLGANASAHEAFFRQMLGDIDEPTLPFGLNDVHLDGQGISESHQLLPQTLSDRLRIQARRLGVSLASLCHVAFGQVLARCSNRETVIFGTVLFGRLQGGEGVGWAIGPFINTLPLRLDLDDTTVEQSVRQTHQRLAELMQHEHASLVLAQRCSNVAASTPLFSALLNYRQKNRIVDAGTSNRPGTSRNIFQGVDFLGSRANNNYPFDLNIDDDGQTLELTFRVVGSLSSQHMCDLMQCALEHLAEALERVPTMSVREIEVLPEAERELLLHTWNQTDAPYPADRCVHHLFEEQVDKTPNAIAVVRDVTQLTYTQLNAQANRLAHRLIALGVRPDSRVAICADRYPHMVVGILAILKAGGAYVPLDPGYPTQRLTEVLVESQPLLLLTDIAGRKALGDVSASDLPALSLDDSSEDGVHSDIASSASSNPGINALTPSHLAYVVYTSGSTGRPKGVAMPHQPLVNLIHWQNSAASHPSGQSRTLQFAALGFDVSFQEIAATLCAGGCLVLIDDSIRRDPFELVRYIQSQKIERVFFPVVALQSFAEAAMANGAPLPVLRHVSTSGAQLRITPAIQQLFKRLPHCRLHNQYGPAESHVVTEFTMPESVDTWQALPSIGAPIPNTRVYLLNHYGHPVPSGAIGEIYIGGVGIASGYLNRPELTNERFLQDPFCSQSGARMYRSGDLARYRPDGSLEVMGRADQQVKIRGFRVEPGEIEARLAKHPAIREAVVLAREDLPGDKRLVAYVTAQPDAVIDVLDLRAHLAQQLPDYMVPAAFVQLDTLPVTHNGKLDLKALPTPDGDASAHRVYEAPQGEIEQCLAEIWSELLEVERIGRHDHFFELGGHSLLLIQLFTRLRDNFGIDIPLAKIINAPTIASLAPIILDKQIELFSTDDIDRISGELSDLSDDEIRVMFDSKDRLDDLKK